MQINLFKTTMKKGYVLDERELIVKLEFYNTLFRFYLITSALILSLYLIIPFNLMPTENYYIITIILIGITNTFFPIIGIIHRAKMLIYYYLLGMTACWSAVFMLIHFWLNKNLSIIFSSIAVIFIYCIYVVLYNIYEKD
ncbi:MAG: hypothetical protein K0R54_2747 [Clostridiaceae bacterium]|jgi:hypothetical protein|nr:hypothetical protein [Clostridiaceae bacterium]MDF2950465.1 hypothetical protein [Anaerocolumna sp.]